jgi:CheY-like chemotaxis protein
VSITVSCTKKKFFRSSLDRIADKASFRIHLVSLDPQLADVRKEVLEEAGYRVIPAKTVVKIRSACERQRLDLILIGYSLPPAEKRRVRHELRQHCKGVPVLLLYEAAEAELTQESAESGLLEDAPHTHQSRTARDFLQAVQQILGD